MICVMRFVLILFVIGVWVEVNMPVVGPNDPYIDLSEGGLLLRCELARIGRYLNCRNHRLCLGVLAEVDGSYEAEVILL